MAILAAEGARTSTSEAVVFWILGAIALLGAVGVVAAPKAVYSAVFLASTMIALAVLYIAQEALFLGVVQVVVYTGAVMMLFLFVLMLIGVDLSEALTETLHGQRPAAIAAGIGLGVLLIAGIGNVSVAGFRGLPEPSGQSASSLAESNGSGNVEALAALLFTRYLWAFELTGALLITAALGAMVLAHRERFDRRKTQRELAIERFAEGGHPTPMPNPGVYARHNAVDVPARLPDGSASPLSVSGILQARDIPGSTDGRNADR
ncbi:NADH-quinone oxidoreductase subunit J [Mycobacterium sp. WMMD1722]|uniref:NADH-quinone oxidoreductase subunit J n=1 Tax=Mycobacterium sp. WMMD1722 TaxID=3404117 RepID=UPI003BF56492